MGGTTEGNAASAQRPRRTRWAARLTAFTAVARLGACIRRNPVREGRSVSGDAICPATPTSVPRRRQGAKVAYAAVCALALAATPAMSSGGEQPPGPGTAQFEEVLAHAKDAPPPAPSEAAVAQSQTAYGGLTDGEAIDVARDHLAEILHARLIPELELEPGQRIVGYSDAFTARISEHAPETSDADGGPAYLQVESTLPLRAPEEGQQKPLDADITAQGDHFEAENAPVEAEIPANLADGIDFPSADMTVTPVRSGPAEATTVSDEVFYPNGAGEDSDYLVAPTATGAEIAVLLRSPDSPTTFPLDVEVPAGASLSQRPDGGAEIAAAGEPIAQISPPRAWDAAKREIAVRYEFQGEELIIQVDRGPAEDVLWPITVDPVIQQYDWEGTNPNLDYWWWAASNTNDFNGFYDASEGGITNRAREGRSFATGAYGEWLVNSIGDSWIERVDFFNWDHVRTDPGGCTTLGIWMPDQFQWAPVTIYNPMNGTQTTGTSAAYCQTQTHQTRSVWVGASDYYDGAYGDAEAYDHSMGVFALTSNQGYRANQMSNLLRSANVWRYVRDTTPPALTASGKLVDTPNPYVPSDFDASFSATDNRSGVRAVRLYVDDQEVDARTQSCPLGSGCSLQGRLWPGRTAFTPGPHTYRIVAEDDANNYSAPRTGTFVLDPDEPTLSLSGSLVEREGQSLESGTVSIGVSDTGSVVSNVSKLRVLIGTQEVLNRTLNCSSGCPVSSWTYNRAAWGAGPHWVTIEATDRAGNVATEVLYTDDFYTDDVSESAATATCPSVSPTTLSGGQTLTQAQAQSRVLPSLIAPSQSAYSAEIETTVDPSLGSAEAGWIPAIGTLSGSDDRVRANSVGAVMLGEMACLVPTQTTSGKTGAGIVNGDTAVWANSAPDTDTFVRPTASGMTMLQSIRGPAAPDSYSWQVALPEDAGGQLRALSSGRIAVVDPAEPSEIDDGWVVPAPTRGPSAPANIPRADTQLEESLYEPVQAERTAGVVVGTVLARPRVVFADGTTAPTTATVTSTTVDRTITYTLTVHSQPDAVAIQMRWLHARGKCKPHTGLDTYWFGITTTWYVNGHICILKQRNQYDKDGVYARWTAVAAPQPHVSARLQTRSYIWGTRAASSKEVVNPDFPSDPENPYVLRTEAKSARARWCARLMEHFLDNDGEKKWRTIQIGGVPLLQCAHLNPFNDTSSWK